MKFGTWCKVAWRLDPLGIATALTPQAPAHGGKECYGDALEARKCFLRECRSGNEEMEGGEDGRARDDGRQTETGAGRRTSRL